MKRQDVLTGDGLADAEGKVRGAACAVVRVERRVLVSVRSVIAAMMTMVRDFGLKVVIGVVVMVRITVLFDAAGTCPVVVRLSSGVVVRKFMKREMQRRNHNRRKDESKCREHGGATL